MRSVQRALVTGGAGFIGSNIVKELLKRDVDVVTLDNLSSGYRENLADFRTSLVEGDVRDPRTVEAAMTGCDTVFHLAASVGNARSIEHPIEDSEINVIGTLRVLESARRLGVQKVVFSSSAGIFGELKHLPISEDHSAEPDSPYGASKLGAEKLCLAYAKVHGLETVCLRYFNVYGPYQRYDPYGNVIPTFVHRILNREPLVIFGDGDQTRDFVNVEDVVRANLLAALTGGVWGAFNIASGAAVTINRLADLLQVANGFPLNVRHEPPRTGDVRHSLADISAAGKAFGYSPTVTLERGLPEYLAWAREHMA
jgi:UDP-glucose 4-epimerase